MNKIDNRLPISILNISVAKGLCCNTCFYQIICVNGVVCVCLCVRVHKQGFGKETWVSPYNVCRGGGGDNFEPLFSATTYFFKYPPLLLYATTLFLIIRHNTLRQLVELNSTVLQQPPAPWHLSIVVKWTDC